MKRNIFLSFALVILSGCQSKPQYRNNYDNSLKASFWKWQWERLTTPKPPEPPFQPEIIKTDMAFLRSNHETITLTWIGHASSLLQLQGLNILIDPIFSERASPFSFIGPKRLAPLPFELHELPPIDVVMISHSHYDHLDLPTLKELAQRNPNRILFLVPLGVKALLQSEGIENVQEFDWWQGASVKNLKFTFTPSQHWSSRTPFDENETLWGGWHIHAPKFDFLYAGDTGYSKDFQDIHARLGAVDIAMIPIGAYEPRWFMKKHHANPEEAVQIHKDLQAKTSIGVHWGTFRLSDEPMLKPVEDLAAALKATTIQGEFKVMKHGETMRVLESR
jgi:N-acyl-phosphatidylethanolamine-hydrolysing phospholipase D